MKTRMNMNKIAKGLGAERGGRVSAKGGYFGALELVSEIEARFRVPARGGRPTDPRWTERRLVPLAPRTLEKLEKLSAKIRTRAKLNIEPMQLAGLLLERTTESVTEQDVQDLVGPR